VLQQTFVHHGLAAGVLVGVACSSVGVYVLLKRIVFLGIALAQLASAGVALALLLGWNPLLTALLASVAGAVGFSQLRWRGGVPVEAGLAVAYVVAAALGIVFIARNPVGEARALTVVFGSLLAVPDHELVALAVVTAAVALVHWRFRKEFVFVSFDPDTAAAHGVRARLWDLALHLTLGVAIAFSIRTAGVLVTFALLVIPALGGRLLTAGIDHLFATAVILATLSVPVGLAAALVLDLPTGATIALAVTALAAIAVAARRGGRWLRAATAVAAAASLLAGAGPTEAQTDALTREVQALREAVGELRRIVEEQQRVIQELTGARPARPPVAPVPPAPPTTAVAPPAPGPAPSTPAPAEAGPLLDQPRVAARLPPYLALLPEMRVEGNIIGNYTLRHRRKLERALGEEREGEEFFVRRNRLNFRELELGLRSAVDPFARLEAILSAEQDFEGDLGVRLEEGILTFGALPGAVVLKIGKMRTTFGEFNDSDPEELPEVDPPNVITNLFGREGDGWIDTGLHVSRLFGITDTLSVMLSAGVFNGDNETAFHGGRAGVARRPAWFGRMEGFYELGGASGLETGLAFAAGHALDEHDRASLRSQIVNAHVEFEHRDPVLAFSRGVKVLSEVFYALRQEEDTHDTLGRLGLYALAEGMLSRDWSLGARLDYSQLPERGEEGGPRLRHETAGSFIVSYRPSRFLILRGQYKHTERNFAPDADELFLQALFKIGYERPGGF
jgi:ABC-type Mn2+/Zn2+ transport system permease subunit